MDAHKDMSVFSRLEVVELGRRRRWTDAEKLRIVEESYAGHRMVAATARRHGISRTLLMTWRRAHAEGRLRADPPPTFAPVVMTEDRPVAPAPREPAPEGDRIEGGRIEIVLGNGRRIVVGPDIDLAALTRLVEALDRR